MYDAGMDKARLQGIRDGLNVASALVVACATVALFIITYWYANLTRDMMRLQVEPEISYGFETISQPKTLVLRNTGTEPIVDVNVYLRAHFFRPNDGMSLGTHFAGYETVGEQKPVWHLDRLESNQFQSKDASEVLTIFAKNRQAEAAFLKVPAVIALVELEIRYHRQIDHKLYVVRRSVPLFQTNTGQGVVSSQLVPSYPNLQEFQRAVPPLN